MNRAVDLDSIDVVLGGQQILRGISMTIHFGESFAIVGPNGSGKTTLLRLLATLLRPAAGHGSILGNDINQTALRNSRPEIGLVSHITALIDELTLGENLAHFAAIADKSNDECVRSLRAVGLEGATDRRASDSSFGMKRRTEIAWLLVARPKLVLLDEARTGLDTEAKQLIDALIELTLERDGSVVAVSHEMTQLGEGFDSVLQLDGGRLRTLA